MVKTFEAMKTQAYPTPDAAFEIIFQDYDIPLNLTVPQRDMLLSLQKKEMIDFVNFLGYQLISEAYNFSTLPLSMKSRFLQD